MKSEDTTSRFQEDDGERRKKNASMKYDLLI
jgi:hypothetical protein